MDRPNAPRKTTCIFVGVFDPKSTNYSQARCLERQGCTVQRFEYRKIASKIGVSQRNQMLDREIQNVKPDFVLFSKANTVDVRAITGNKNLSKMLLWYMDPMNSNWNAELIEKVKNCHAVACALWRPYEEAKKLNLNSYFLHEGFDPEVDKPMARKGEKYDVVFIGNMNSQREEYRKAYPFQVLNAWREDHAKKVGNSLINLNFVRTASGCSDRVYKILAAGGFLLTQPWPMMDKDFVPGLHLDIFTTPQEMNIKIEYYLKKAVKREEIAQAGLQRVQCFSRNHWAKKILEIVEKV